ncbi:MAG TPA: monovalent cation/H(+) antiporter subunit G [Actinomycetota bacterium]|nr:monovalent cation/H(+) antiporter subunit G [Actinomycetota bacterium]
MREILASILLLSGVAFVLLAGIGLQRFPDVFARMHAATKAATLGLLLVLAGTALQLSSPGDVAKLVLVAGLMFVTAPVGAHMVGRAAYRAGNELSPETSVDELADKLAAEAKGDRTVEPGTE